uniref:Uncharacterized protein n=1 Tax=Phytophthora ramorum TaxID=164328 RepID=H3GDT6_PHYRM
MEAKHHVVVGNPLNVKVQQTINHCVIDQATAYSSPCSTSASSAAASSLFDAQYGRYRPTVKGYWKETAGLCVDVLCGLSAHATDGYPPQSYCNRRSRRYRRLRAGSAQQRQPHRADRRSTALASEKKLVVDPECVVEQINSLEEAKKTERATSY